MRTATVMTAKQTLYFNYKDYSRLDLILNKKNHPIDNLKKQLSEQGYFQVGLNRPLNINEKGYHLFT